MKATEVSQILEIVLGRYIEQYLSNTIYPFKIDFSLNRLQWEYIYFCLDRSLVESRLITTTRNTVT